MTKREFRAKAKLITKTLSLEHRLSYDASITDTLFELPVVRTAQSIFCYVSVKNEPDTCTFIAWCLENGKTVAVPRCYEGGEMKAHVIETTKTLVQGYYGLLEPSQHSPILHKADIDLCIMPCVATDRQGNRLGHGGGYYDRFVPFITAPTVCLCYGALVFDSLPTGPHDAKPDLIVTEMGLHKVAANNE